MLLLAAVLFCLFTYKLLTKWIWPILAIAIIYDFGLWIVSHVMLSIVIVCIALGAYDKFVYQRTHDHSLFGTK